MAATWPNITAKAPRFADRLEAWGAASLLGGFKVLPLDSASTLGGALARRIGPFLGVSKHSRRNISRAFPSFLKPRSRASSPACGTISAASRPNTRIYGTSASSNRAGWSRTHGFEHVDRAVAAGRRMILFSGHIANWEIAMLAGIQYGISVAQIYRAGNNPLLDRMIARFRG